MGPVCWRAPLERAAVAEGAGRGAESSEGAVAPGTAPRCLRVIATDANSHGISKYFMIVNVITSGHGARAVAGKAGRGATVTDGTAWLALLLVLLLFTKVLQSVVFRRSKQRGEFGGSADCSRSAAVRSSPLVSAAYDSHKEPGRAKEAVDKRRNVMKPFSAGGMTCPCRVAIIQRTLDSCWNSHHIAKAVQRSTVYLWTSERRLLRPRPGGDGLPRGSARFRSEEYDSLLATRRQNT